MARDFSASGSAVVASGFSTYFPIRTISVWVYRTGLGGGNAGTVFSNAPSLLWDFGSVYEFYQNFSINPGSWRIAMPTADAWHHICITYSDSSVLNDAVFYVDGSTVVVTETNVAAGVPQTTVDEILIGNLAGNSFNWGGSLAEFAFYNAILSQPRITQLAAGVSAAFVQPENLGCYVPIWGYQAPEYQFKKGSAPLCPVTGTSLFAHPIVIAQGIRSAGGQGAGY